MTKVRHEKNTAGSLCHIYQNKTHIAERNTILN